VRDRIELLERVPGKLKKLEMDILKNENLFLEGKLQQDQISKQVDIMQNLNSQGQELQKKLSLMDGLDSTKILEEVVRITTESQLRCVHKDEFLDLRAETGEMVNNINELKVFRMKLEEN